MTMYIRVKRQKQTIFLYTDLMETIADVKKKIGDINNIPPARIRLIYNDHPLEDNKTIGDYKIENDKIVFMVYKKEGSEEYEPIDVHMPQPMKYEEKKE